MKKILLFFIYFYSFAITSILSYDDIEKMDKDDQKVEKNLRLNPIYVEVHYYNESDVRECNGLLFSVNIVALPTKCLIPKSKNLRKNPISNLYYFTTKGYYYILSPTNDFIIYSDNIIRTSPQEIDEKHKFYFIFIGENLILDRPNSNSVTLMTPKNIPEFNLKLFDEKPQDKFFNIYNANRQGSIKNQIPFDIFFLDEYVTSLNLIINLSTNIISLKYFSSSFDIQNPYYDFIKDKIPQDMILGAQLYKCDNAENCFFIGMNNKTERTSSKDLNYNFIPSLYIWNSYQALMSQINNEVIKIATKKPSDTRISETPYKSPDANEYDYVLTGPVDSMSKSNRRIRSTASVSETQSPPYSMKPTSGRSSSLAEKPTRMKDIDDEYITAYTPVEKPYYKRHHQTGSTIAMPDYSENYNKTTLSTDDKRTYEGMHPSDHDKTENYEVMHSARQHSSDYYNTEIVPNITKSEGKRETRDRRSYTLSNQSHSYQKDSDIPAPKAKSKDETRDRRSYTLSHQSHSYQKDSDIPAPKAKSKDETRDRRSYTLSHQSHSHQKDSDIAEPKAESKESTV